MKNVFLDLPSLEFGTTEIRVRECISVSDESRTSLMTFTLKINFENTILIMPIL